MTTKKKLSDRITNIKILKSWVILVIDMILSLAATLLSLLAVRLLLSYDITGVTVLRVSYMYFVGSFAGFFLLKTYKKIIRHSSFKDIGALGLASIIKTVVTYGLYMIVWARYVTDPNAFITCAFIDFLLTFVFLVSVRVVMITVYNTLLANINNKGDKVLVYGMGQKSASLVNFLNQSNKYDLAGFLAYDAAGTDHVIGEYRVYGFNDERDFEKIYNRIHCRYILFPTFVELNKEKNRLVKFCQKRNVRMLISPNIDQVHPNNGVLKLGLREIKIEDLLGRDEIRINLKAVTEEFSGKTIMVTGAAGSIGSELCRQLAELKVKRLIMFDDAETPLHNIRLYMDEKYGRDSKLDPIDHVEILPMIGDVRSIQRLEMVFSMYKPDVVFHAAAYKHVPLMEDNPCEAIYVNVVGSRNVADCCVKYGVRNMIMISTDKAVNPTNVMGATKRAAEMYVQSLGIELKEGRIKGVTKFTTTRFGNVLGSNGSVIPRFREQIEKGGPLTVTDERINRFFMSIPEASRLVLEAATMGEGCDIFVFDMGEPVKIIDLATRMIELAGYKANEEIKIKITGLRPGEKIQEEVLSDKEHTLPTQNKKIRVAQVRPADYTEVSKTIDELYKLSVDVDVMGSVKTLKKLIPEYISNHSQFEKLDKK